VEAGGVTFSFSDCAWLRGEGGDGAVVVGGASAGKVEGLGAEVEPDADTEA
jgi:hypothetical protein